MELRQFKYFLSIVDNRSLSRAAHHLYVAQSALSRQVADLEAELGVKLLVRNNDGVVESDAGKVFYEYAQGITKQLSDLRMVVRCASDAVAGSVMVAIPRSTSAMLPMPLLRAVALRYPNVVLHLNEELTGNMPEQILRGVLTLRCSRQACQWKDLISCRWSKKTSAAPRAGRRPLLCSR